MLTQQTNGELLEKVILQNDLAGLTSIEKVQYVKNVCQTLGLNPMTKPLQLLKFQGREILYFAKDATEQLRKNNNISITKIENKLLEGGIYVVTAYAETKDGRQDSSTGAIVINGMKGDQLANALMKCETKAKRRVTLSICGLGFIDESEAESIPNSVKVEIPHSANEEIDNFNEILLDIQDCQTLSDLEAIFIPAYRKYAKHENKEILKQLIDAKDIKKLELTTSEEN